MEKYVEKNVNLHAFAARVLFRRKLLLLAVLVSLAAGALLSVYLEKRRVSTPNEALKVAAEKAEEAELQESQKEADILGLTDLQRQKVQDAFRAYRVYKDAISRFSGMYGESLAAKTDLAALHRKQTIYRVSTDNRTAIALLVKKYLGDEDFELIRQIVAEDLPGVNPRDLVSVSDVGGEDADDAGEDAAGAGEDGAAAAVGTETAETEEEDESGLFTTFICAMSIGSGDEECDEISKVVEDALMRCAVRIRESGIRLLIRPSYDIYETGLTNAYYHKSDSELTSLRNVYGSYVTLMNNVIDKFSLSETEYFNILCESLKTQTETASSASGETAGAADGSGEGADVTAAGSETAEELFKPETFSRRRAVKKTPALAAVLFLFLLLVWFLCYLSSDRIMTGTSLAAALGAPILARIRVEDLNPRSPAEKLAVSILAKDTETDPEKALRILRMQLSSIIGTNSLRKICFWSDVEDAASAAFVGRLTGELKKDCPDTEFCCGVSLGGAELEHLMDADGIVVLSALSKSTFAGVNGFLSLARNTNRPVCGVIVNNSPANYRP